MHQAQLNLQVIEQVNTFTGSNSMVGCRTKDEGQYDAIARTNYAHGGGMMVSTQSD